MTAPQLSMKDLRRVVIAAAVGNVIEWYDFYIFGGLGGEYGGAITYVAEHAPDEKRGYYTGWLQTSPTLGIVLSLAVIVVTRESLGPEAFAAWGWRIPFVLSPLMVAIAIYIRLRLQETPIFQAIKARGQTSANPWREAFWGQNVRYVLIASVVV